VQPGRRALGRVAGACRERPGDAVDDGVTVRPRAAGAREVGDSARIANVESAASNSVVSATKPVQLGKLGEACVPASILRFTSEPSAPIVLGV
jgi:hypothetical protein